VPVKKPQPKSAVERKRCSKCGLNRMIKFYAPNARVCDPCKKKGRRATGRKSHLETRYDITPAEYKKLLERHGNRCWICDGLRPYNLQVDHDHDAEERVGTRLSIRGLLCKRCNKLLRDCGDSIMILSKAIDYLKNGKRMVRLVIDPGD